MRDRHAVLGFDTATPATVVGVVTPGGTPVHLRHDPQRERILHRCRPAREAAVLNLKRHPELLHDESIWHRFTEEIFMGMGGPEAIASECAVEPWLMTMTPIRRAGFRTAATPELVGGPITMRATVTAPSVTAPPGSDTAWTATTSRTPHP